MKLEDGSLVRLKAAGAAAARDHPPRTRLRLVRLAWHIGNRHTPAEITADAIYIERDHVLAEMVRGQGGLAPRGRAAVPSRSAGPTTTSAARIAGTITGMAIVITNHDHGHGATLTPILNSSAHAHAHSHAHDHD